VGVRDLLLEFLNEAEPDVREVLTEVLVAEQRKIDSSNPKGIKEEIRDIVDARVRSEEPQT
jgi:hypothetical protein